MKKFIILNLLFCFLMMIHCRSAVESQIPIKLDFNKWRESVLEKYDSISTNEKGGLYRRLSNPKMVKDEINYVTEGEILNLLSLAFKKNRLKNWDEMYIVYHFLEGEVNISLTSIVFFRNNRCWGFTHCHNNDKNYKINTKFAPNIKLIRTALHGGGNGLSVVSEFNREMHNNFNNIVTGVSYSQELAPLMKIYDERIFD